MDNQVKTDTRNDIHFHNGPSESVWDIWFREYRATHDGIGLHEKYKKIEKEYRN